MEFRRFTDADAFRRIAEPFLAGCEAQHGVMLGILGGLSELPKGALAACVVDGSSSNHALAVALRLDYRLLVSRVQRDGALPVLASGLRDDCGTHILGAPDTVVAVATAIGRQVIRRLDQGIYECTRIVGQSVVPAGYRRPATPDDESTLTEWRIALDAVLGQSISVDAARERVRDLTRLAAMHVWQADGEIRSCAAAVAPTARGIRISHVYTPPSHRGRGYAGALVADLTTALLAQGRAFTFLHTDLANPVSNRLYQRIGYERVGDFAMWELAQT